MADDPARLAGRYSLDQVPIPALQTRIDADAIDANGHMSSSSYFLLFQRGLAAMFRPIGFGSRYRERGLTVFQRDIHISYRREMKLGDPVDIRSWLVSLGTDRLRHYHEMRRGLEGPLCATADVITVNISLTDRRPAQFPQDVSLKLNDLLDRSLAVLPTSLPKSDPFTRKKTI